MVDVNVIRRAARMRILARIGLVARATVYFLIGFLALLVALGVPGGRTTDSRGVLDELLRKPLGSAALVAIAFGLVCYAIWRVTQSIGNPERWPRNSAGYGMRLGRAFTGVFHAFLAGYAFNLVFWVHKPTSGRLSEQALARWALTWRYGHWLIASVGVGIVIFGLSQVLIALREQFVSEVRIPPERAPYFYPICKFGLVARGIVFALIGVFLVHAGWRHRAADAGGMKTAWTALRDLPYGEYLVGVVAMGFIAYGILSLAEARYFGEQIHGRART